MTLRVDGEPIRAFAGETVAVALLAAGIRRLGSSPRHHQPRGLFCAIGVCQECVVRVDGRPVASCTEPVRDGMEITLGGESE